MPIWSRLISRAEDADGIAADGGGAGDVEGEGALAEAWARGEHNHIGALHAVAQQVVDALEAGWHGRDVRDIGAVKGGAFLHVGVEHLADVYEIA